MSYAELKIVKKNGDVVGYKEYNNAFGGAAFIWTKLYDKYLKDQNIPYDSWLLNREKLWKLSKDESIPFFARVVLNSTYDHVIIKRENILDLANALEKFLEIFPPSKGTICHLGNWVNDLRDIYKDKSIRGIAFYQTSVSQDLWNIYNDNEEDDSWTDRDYNIEKDEGHWFLFDEIEDFIVKNKRL